MSFQKLHTRRIVQTVFFAGIILMALTMIVQACYMTGRALVALNDLPSGASAEQQQTRIELGNVANDPRNHAGGSELHHSLYDHLGVGGTGDLWRRYWAARELKTRCSLDDGDRGRRWHREHLWRILRPVHLRTDTGLFMVGVGL